ncbi:hypothetical protein BGZ65_011207, partial [Modicella reniformis]
MKFTSAIIALSVVVAMTQAVVVPGVGEVGTTPAVSTPQGAQDINPLRRRGLPVPVPNTDLNGINPNEVVNPATGLLGPVTGLT